MPLKRIGEGLIVVGLVSIAAMIVVALLSRSDSAALTISAVLGFAASTIGGVFAILRKLEDVLSGQVKTQEKVDDVHVLVNECVTNTKEKP